MKVRFSTPILWFTESIYARRVPFPFTLTTLVLGTACCSLFARRPSLRPLSNVLHLHLGGTCKTLPINDTARCVSSPKWDRRFLPHATLPPTSLPSLRPPSRATTNAFPALSAGRSRGEKGRREVSNWWSGETMGGRGGGRGKGEEEEEGEEGEGVGERERTGEYENQ